MISDPHDATPIAPSESLSEEQEELPLGWSRTTLGEISDVQGGVTKDSKNQSDKDEEFPYLRVANVQRGYLDLTEIRTIRIPAAKAENLFLKPGDVLFNEGGDADKLGRGWIWEGQIDRCAFQNHVFRARMSDSNIQSKYISWWGNSRGMEFFLRNAKQTTNLASINRSMLVQLPINLPPLQEQIRIADKLDALLSRVETGRERLERVPGLLKRFRQSVLSAAVGGELTREWRGGGDAEWEEVTLKSLAHSITDGDHQAPPQSESGIPFITISAINDGRLRLEKSTRFVETSYLDSLKSSRVPKLGDILYSVTGTICIPAIVDIETPFVFQRHIAIIKPDFSAVSSEYLYYALGSDQTKKQGMELATGTAQPTVALSSLRGLIIPLPPRLEQAEIVRRVEALFAIADRIEARYQLALTTFNRLTPALLTKAFRGELVPQDPNDEPASVLLERIRAMRAASGEKPKRGRGAAKGAAKTAVGVDGAPVDGAQSKRRGRPPKARAEASGPASSIPQADSYEDAVRRLEAQKAAASKLDGAARAQGTRQPGLFESAEAEVKP